ncbi:MAG: 50S ribosomal protein L5 [Candidatus Liptonbacteria bacterium]|nr:50S ribosomal protein L5 [Candidatus Liptonbacteria bacterium]
MSHIATQQREMPFAHIEKIVVNVGVGRLSQQQNFEEKILPQIKRDIALLSGQEPQVRRAKQAVAGFKIRQGHIVGVRATLRSRKMSDFLRRLIAIVLPRVRDFRGIPLSAVDHGGALHIGLGEQMVFPEVNPEQSPISFSLQVSVVPTTRNREEALHLYKRLGVPLRGFGGKKRAENA